MKSVKNLPKSNDHMFLAQSEESIKHMLSQWKIQNLPGDIRLIHTIPSYTRFDGPLFRQCAEDVLNTWDVISTSLIDINKIRRVSTDLKGTIRRQNAMFYEIGFVLDVPCQNIIGTFKNDVYFPNHAGRENASPVGKVINSAALFEHISSGERKLKSNGERLPPVVGGYNQISSPMEILNSTNNYKHNEILVIGKSGVNIYKGLPATDRIEVIAIVISPKVIPRNHSENVEFKRRWNIIKNNLAGLNPNVPCQFI
ncbi:Uncharacterised protein [Buttiauxella agrestis]|uniref:Uncharacterized protein n=1 Tax=Buttiauxella agrestis TaxID=82977 RepID=A0A381KMW5_9ENTR|nr:hypothetical protein [Buttiauxella agrestis]SUY92714.1 Uncharacterised protein [Buttiauxella agrestis]